MFKIAAYVAAWKLRQAAERKQQAEQPQLRIEDYGDNGTEGQFYLLTDNFR